MFGHPPLYLLGGSGSSSTFVHTATPFATGFFSFPYGFETEEVDDIAEVNFWADPPACRRCGKT